MSTDRPGILLVDDEPRIQDFISRALLRAGYEIDCAATGRDALRLLREGEYCLVILDLVMPGTDGREVLAELLRASPDQAGARAVLPGRRDDPKWPAWTWAHTTT